MRLSATFSTRRSVRFLFSSNFAEKYKADPIQNALETYPSSTAKFHLPPASTTFLYLEKYFVIPAPKSNDESTVSGREKY